jgi:hypothetical protein
LSAVDANRRIKLNGTDTAVVAIGSALAVRCIAVHTSPARVAEALMIDTVARTMAGAILGFTRAAGNLAEGSSPAFRIALARAVYVGLVAANAVARAENIASDAMIACITDTIAAICGRLMTMETNIGAGRTHPSRIAINALWWIGCR